MMIMESVRQRDFARLVRATRFVIVLVFLLSLAVASPPALASRTWDGGAATDDWMDAANWDADGVPSAEPVTIDVDAADVTLNDTANDITSLSIATSSSTSLSCSLTIGSGGSLTESSGGLNVGINNRTGATFGALTLDGGSFTISSGSGTIGAHTSSSVSGGSGTLNINSGTLTFYNVLRVGQNNVFGEVVQAGGALSNVYNKGGLRIGLTTGTAGDGNASGEYTISDGTIELAGVLGVGYMGRGTSATNVGDAHGLFTQTGGEVSLGVSTTGGSWLDMGLGVGTTDLYGPYKGTSTGVYKLLGGTLTTSGISIGMAANYEQTYSGSGTFEFGDANGTGTLAQRSGANRNILVRTSSYSDGTFTGWGTVGLTGTLTNNGRVIADGFGTSRSLDFSGMGTVANTIENASGTEAENDTINGWYAVNSGKLLLPKVVVDNSAGSFSCNLGEATDDTNIDLVNSVRITLTKGATTGTQTVDANLYDKNHSSVPTIESSFPVVGLWEINPTFTISTADMVFRYNDALAGALAADESALRIFHYDAGSSTWERLPNTSVDTTNKRITVTGVTSFGFFLAGVAPFDYMEDYGVDFFYKTYWGNLTVTPLGNGTSRITRSGGAVFTSAFEGKMFESARIHKNPITYPSTGANYIPKAVTVRYATVTTVESATSLIVDFEYNGGNETTPQATSNTDGFFFADNKEAFEDYVADEDRKAECRWNGVLPMFGLPHVAVTSDLIFNDLRGTKDNIYLKFFYSDDFDAGPHGGQGCGTWTQYSDVDHVFDFGNADIDIDLPQLLPTIYRAVFVDSLSRDIHLLYDTGSTTSTATGHKKTYNWQQYKERDEMVAALGSVRPGASFGLPIHAYCLGGGTDNGTDVTAFNIYEMDGGWTGRVPMGIKAKYRSGILFWVHGTETQRADFIEMLSLKATHYDGIQTKFTDNRTCVIDDNTFTFYHMANQYWLGGTSTSSTNPNEVRVTLNDTEYRLYFGNTGDWRHEAQSTTIPTVLTDGATAMMFNKIPVANDTITLGIANLGGFKSANVIRVWGWAMTVGTQLSISGTTYTVTACSRQFTNDGTYSGYCHYFDCTLDGSPTQAATATVVSSPLSALLDGNYRSANHVYNRDPGGHLCYTDQETNMRWENVNFSGYVRATGEYDNSDDLYKMTSIAEFTNCFCVNEDGTPCYSEASEWNPVSLRRRQLLTSNNNYRVKISGGRIFWRRKTAAQPEVIFTNRPQLIDGFADPRLLNPYMGDTQGLILGSGDGSSPPFNNTACSIVLADGHSINLSNTELRGQLNLAGHGSVNLSNLTTHYTPGSQTQYYGCAVVGVVNGFTIPTRNLTITGDGGMSGFRQTAVYAIGNLVFNLTNWSIVPTYYCADGFSSLQDQQDPDYGDYISINGEVLY